MRVNSIATPSVLNTVLGAGNVRRHGSNESMFDRNGDMNAGSIRELASGIVELTGRLQAGEFQGDINVASAEERRAMFDNAWNSSDLQAWAEVGSDISATITDRVARLGFARRFLTRGDLKQGSIPRHRVKHHNVDAVMATGPTRVAVQIVRDKYLMPEEFTISTNIRVEEREIQQGTNDILEEKFMEGLEGILVKEDRVWKNLADTAAPLVNDISYYNGGVTPGVLGKLKEQVTRWSLPAISLTMANNVLTDITTGNGFENFFEPVSRLQILTTGTLGVILGMELVTDGFRDPRLKVLNNGELYVTTMPDHLGAYTDRGPVQSEPRVNDKDFPGRGWFQHELVSFCVANPRGVARAIRL